MGSATSASSTPISGGVDVRRSRTRRRLQQALVELSLDKGFQNLTVENFLERAEITRATFYAHFRDKDELLTSVADAVVTDVLERFESIAPEFEGRRLLALFEDAQREPDRLRVVLRGEGDGIALRHFTDRVAAIIDEVDPLGAPGSNLDPTLARTLATRAFAGQILAVLSWWLELDEQPSPTDIVRDLRTLAQSGRNPGPPPHAAPEATPKMRKARPSKPTGRAAATSARPKSTSTSRPKRPSDNVTAKEPTNG